MRVSAICSWLPGSTEVALRNSWVIKLIYLLYALESKWHKSLRKRRNYRGITIVFIGQESSKWISLSGAFYL